MCPEGTAGGRDIVSHVLTIKKQEVERHEKETGQKRKIRKQQMQLQKRLMRSTFRKEQTRRMNSVKQQKKRGIN